MFGRPGEGAHALRVGGVAAVDLGLTLAASWLVAATMRVPFWKVALCMLVLGILVHRIFCVNTALNVALFGRM